MAALAAGCGAPATISDQRPQAVPGGSLASTLWIASPTETGISGFASAVILGPRTLLTSAHVWAVEEPWWEAELPARRSLALFRPATRGRMRVDGAGVGVELPARTVVLEFDLVGSARRGPPHDLQEDLSDDWVLIETSTPCWDPEDAATPHPSAGDPTWTVRAGTELMVAGYSSVFGGEALRNAGDARDADAGDSWEALVDFLEAGPYTLTGEALELDGLPGLSYPSDWPPPKGHSGGGVYRWDAAAGRALLVGVFHTCVPTRAEVTRRYEPLGLSALSFERRVEQDGQVLVYSPLAPILEAGRRSSR